MAWSRPLWSSQMASFPLQCAALLVLVSLDGVTPLLAPLPLLPRAAASPAGPGTAALRAVVRGRARPMISEMRCNKDRNEGGGGWDDRVDSTMIKNDIAVLSINTLGQAVVELVSKGPKAMPGMTFTDWVIVSRYFSVAGCVCVRAPFARPPGP